MKIAREHSTCIYGKCTEQMIDEFPYRPGQVGFSVWLRFSYFSGELCHPSHELDSIPVVRPRYAVSHTPLGSDSQHISWRAIIRSFATTESASSSFAVISVDSGFVRAVSNVPVSRKLRAAWQSLSHLWSLTNPLFIMRTPPATPTKDTAEGRVF